NPTMKVNDIERLAKAAHEVGAIVMVDNTLATPINQQPINLGADLVVHSATKYLGGHSTAMGGVLCGKKELIEKAYEYRMITGAPLDPGAAFALIQGMKTLEIRIERQNENARKVAEYLKQHPLVEAVYYPGFEDDPAHDIAKKQMSGYGGWFSFAVKGGLDS